MKKKKRRCTLHAGMASEEFVNFIPKDDRPANSRDANPLVTIWIIVDETTYKDPAPKTLDYLRQRPRFTWKIVNLDTLLELVHSIPHRLEMSQRFTKVIFNKQWNLSEEKISLSWVKRFHAGKANRKVSHLVKYLCTCIQPELSNIINVMTVASLACVSTWLQWHQTDLKLNNVKLT